MTKDNLLLQFKMSKKVLNDTISLCSKFTFKFSTFFPLIVKKF